MPYNTNIIGHMVESELKVIEEWAYNIPKNGVIVEIGTFFGRSAVCWAMSSDPSVKIYCGDIWLDLFETGKYNYNIPGMPKSNFKYNLWQDFKNNVKEFSKDNPYETLALTTYGLNALSQQPGESDDAYRLRAQNDPRVAEYITQYGGQAKVYSGCY
jgi:hypothetical protein